MAFENKIKELTHLLIKYENLRERSKKNKLIAKLVQMKYPHELENISLDRIQEIIVDSWSYDRAWRKVLQDNDHLRGRDYDDKKILEQEAELGMGYAPGFHNDTARRTRRKMGVEEPPKVEAVKPTEKSSIGLPDDIPF